MGDITFETPSIIKLGSFAGKTKYCLIDTFFIPLLKIYTLKIHCQGDQLIVVASKASKDIPFHYLIWEYFYQCSIPSNHTIFHVNGIPMDNRLENLLLISNDLYNLPTKYLTSISKSFYWNIISHMPVDMDELDHHNSTVEHSSPYECHNAPCTNLLVNSVDEQFICMECKRVKYCSQVCQSMDENIHSVFCNPIHFE